MQAFKLKLEQALASGAALALLSAPACGGSASLDGASGAANVSGAANLPGTTNVSGAANLSHGGTAASTEGPEPPDTETGGQPATSIGGAAGVAGYTGCNLEWAGGCNADETMPFPVSSLGCSGEFHEEGFHGQCCADALCYTPKDGSECVAPKDAPDRLGVWYGSGECLCDAEIRGPFAANPAHKPQMEGTCCYVISSIGCDGRPLLVDGAPVVSELTRRVDWVARELRELVS